MHDTSPPLPSKAFMFLEMARHIQALTDGVDTSNPLHEILNRKIEDAIDACAAEINNYKEE